MAKWNPLSLKILMFMLGVLLVLGSGFGFIGDRTFLARLTGVSTSMAGVAFGAGLLIAGFNPEQHVSWVRAAILYCILEVLYEIISQFTVGAFDIVAFVIALIIGVLLLVLYPNKSALWMSGGAKAAKPARA